MPETFTVVITGNKYSKIKWRSGFLHQQWSNLKNFVLFLLVVLGDLTFCIGVFDSVCVCYCRETPMLNITLEAYKYWQQAQAHALSQPLYRIPRVLRRMCFICLIQFSTANDSELGGNYGEKRTKNDYWIKIPSIHLSSMVEAPSRKQHCQ